MACTCQCQWVWRLLIQFIPIHSKRYLLFRVDSSSLWLNRLAQSIIMFSAHTRDVGQNFLQLELPPRFKLIDTNRQIQRGIKCLFTRIFQVLASAMCRFMLISLTAHQVIFCSRGNVRRGIKGWTCFREYIIPSLFPIPLFSSPYPSFSVPTSSYLV